MKKQSNRDGGAMIITLYVCMVLGIISVVGWNLAGNATARTSRYSAHAQALALAEGGAAMMYDYVSKDPSTWVDQTIVTNIGDGSFWVHAERTSSRIITIVSTGTVDDVSVGACFEAITDADTYYRSFFTGMFAIVTGGDCTVDTGAVNVQGHIHSNGNLLHTRGNTRINGNLSAVGTVDITPYGGYAAYPGSAYVGLPVLYPFTPWKELAQNGGLYFNSSQVFSKDDFLPGNGVIYVEGDVLVQNRTSLTGTLVATGTITIENRFTQTAYTTNWPCLMAGGDVMLYNRNTYEGLIYAGGNFQTRNNKQIDGCVMALGTGSVENNCDIIPTGKDYDLFPGQPQSSDDAIEPGGWKY